MIPLPRSCRSAEMLLYLVERGSALAFELAGVAGIDSRDVYPYMRVWVEKGLVRVVRGSGTNLYIVNVSLPPVAVEAIKRLLVRCRDRR